MIEVLTRNPGILVAMLVAILVEWAWRSRVARRGYDVAASAASLAVWLGGFVMKPVALLVIAPAFEALASIAPWQFSTGDWRAWVAGFFAVEFAYYWYHRWSHTINWLWATHATHHSANEMTLPAAIRLGWTGPLSGGWLTYAPLILLGFPPTMVATLLAANLLYQFWLHTEAIGKLGPLEWVLNTPSHHRAHHASNEAYLDCNFGGVLILFDRLFGTFVAEPDEQGLSYGLTKPIRSNNPATIALRQWLILFGAMRRAHSLRHALAIAAARPETIDRHPASARD